ncbi:MAG: DUF4143 domain-containing protein [Bacilli bacterium]|nr:DUF4143 domain-containing protein [Bacilli bacterium]
MIKYLPRLIDSSIEDILQDFTAVQIRGPKWCGKTSTCEHFAKSEIKFNTKKQKEEFEQIYSTDPSLFLKGDKPRLIDEWQLYPLVWDEIKNYSDETHLKNQFLLTGSYSPKNGITNHTGSMRIVILDMTTMSLFESGKSTGEVSLKQLFTDPLLKVSLTSTTTREEISELIVRGGWPEGIVNPPRNSNIYGKHVLRSICDTDIQEASGKDLNPQTTLALLHSISRGISQSIDNRTLIADVNASGHPMSEQTFYEYYNALMRLFVVKEIPAWCPMIRSKTSIRSLPKKGLFDPSIACASLEINEKGLDKDYKTRGFLFECLVGRDLAIYANTFDGHLSYYRDRLGLECDYVIHLNNEDYCLIECKCGDKYIEEGAQNLNKFDTLINKYNIENPNKRMSLPKFKLIITDGQYGYRRKDGIIVIPITALRN